MEIREVGMSAEVMRQLLDFSADWVAENCCYGYAANGADDLVGRRVFMAYEGDAPIGYLFGCFFDSENMQSVMPLGTRCFEAEELYVVPAWRRRGVGGALFDFASDALRGEADYVLLSTASRNARSILHFYVDELGMSIWSARLYKRLN